MSDPRPVHLAHVNERGRVLRLAPAWRRQAGSQPVRWLFLGRRYSDALAWEAALGEGFERVPSGAALQQVAGALRGPFVDWVVGLRDQSPGGLRWWASRLAERNTYVSPLFRHLCLVRLALDALAGQDAPTLIVSDNRAVLRTIAAHAAGGGPVTGPRWFPEVIEKVRWGVRFCSVWALHLLRSVRDLLDARTTGRPVTPFTRAGVTRVLMHCCIDEAALRQYGGSSDRYFTVLPEHLRARGCDVVVVPWLENVTRSRRAAFTTLRNSPTPCLLPEDYYRLRDYVWAAGIVIGQLWLVPSTQVVGGIRVDHLMRDAARVAAGDTGLTRFIRYTRLIAALKARRIEFDIFLDKFENMVTEKPQVLALRHHMPSVTTVGFQHYLAPYPLQLHMFTTEAEHAVAPHPDVIVCNSAFAADLFAREGFAGAEFRIGPSLRYLHLQALSRTEPPANTILVMVPLDTGTAAEVMDKVFKAFGHRVTLRVLLKTHPMMSESNWHAACNGRALPDQFARAGGEMAECVRVASCAVVPSGTTTGLELLLAGIPVVVLGRETDLDLNPLGWLPGTVAPVFTVDDLEHHVLDLLSHLPERTTATRAWAERHRAECLSPLTEETIHVFLDPPPPRGHAH